MALTNDEIDRAEEQILLELDREPGPRRPREVINKIRHERGLSDTVLRAAIWYLIDRNVIDLSADLRVRRLAPTRPNQGLLAP